MAPIHTKTTKVGSIIMRNAEREAFSIGMSPKAVKAEHIARITARAEEWVAVGHETINIPGLHYSFKGSKLPVGRRHFKLVGGGSYLSASLYVSVDTEGRERQRGTCQACGGQQVVAGGGIVLHGYSRPGLGWIEGRCYGTHHAPAEHDTSLTKQTITSCTEHAAALRAALAKLPPADRLKERWDDPIPTKRRNLERGALANEQHAEYLRAHVLPRLGRALTTEVVA